MVCCAKNASSDARSVRSRESSDDEDARRTATTASESDEETRVVDDRGDDAFARDRDEDVEAGGGDGRGGGGRRSAWDRAGGDGASDGDESPSHSTFGRDSERRRRMRKTSKLVAERLGGVDSDESDDDEFASGLERARSARRRGGDEEEGFGFVSQADLTRREEERARKKREEERRALEAERARRKAEKLAKKEAKREAKRDRERAREESETASLLDGGRKRKVRRSFFGIKSHVVTYTVVAVSAVVACGVGAVLYSSAASPRTMEIRGGAGTLTTADPTLQPLKATTDKILKGLKGSLKRVTAGTSSVDDVADETEESSSKTSKTKSALKKKSSTTKDEEDEDDDLDADDDVDVDVDDAVVDDADDTDEKKSTKRKKSSKKSKPSEASLGVTPSIKDEEDEEEEEEEDDDVKATPSCAPVQIESKHGIYRQYNKACMEDSGDVLGCVEKSSEGCQSCYLDDSPAATQSSSYSRCSHHVCSAYSVEGCDPKPAKAKSDDDESDAEDGNADDEDTADTAPTVRAKPTLGVTPTVNVEDENCLPNLEDAKRGIFQYTERYCRTFGHIDVDYAGCIAIGKSSCRMCATRSVRGASSVFALCPRSVCQNHDLLFEQCEKDD